MLDFFLSGVRVEGSCPPEENWGAVLVQENSLTKLMVKPRT